MFEYGWTKSFPFQHHPITSFGKRYGIFTDDILVKTLKHFVQDSEDIMEVLLAVVFGVKVSSILKPL